MAKYPSKKKKLYQSSNIRFLDVGCAVVAKGLKI